MIFLFLKVGAADRVRNVNVNIETGFNPCKPLHNRRIERSSCVCVAEPSNTKIYLAAVAVEALQCGSMTLKQRESLIHLTVQRPVRGRKQIDRTI